MKINARQIYIELLEWCDSCDFCGIVCRQDYILGGECTLLIQKNKKNFQKFDIVIGRE